MGIRLINYKCMRVLCYKFSSIANDQLPIANDQLPIANDQRPIVNEKQMLFRVYAQLACLTLVTKRTRLGKFFHWQWVCFILVYH